MKIKKAHLGIEFLLLIIIGCACGTVDETDEIFSSTESSTVSPTITITSAPTEVSSQRPTMEPSLTPITFPTFDPISQDEMVIWLDEKLSHPECNLPCIWGITPGETTIEEAYQIIAPYATEITPIESDIGRNTSGFLFYFSILPYSPGDPTFSFGIEYSNNIVTNLSIWNLQDYQAYSVQNILTHYGPPEEIWLQAWSPDPGWDTEQRGSTIFLYYPKQRFLLQYSQVIEEQIVTEDSVICCPNGGRVLETWSMASENEIDIFYRENYLFNDVRPFLKLEDVTGMTPEEFYAVFVNTTEDVCIETPIDTWFASKSGEFE